jgi:hypothetical protein
LRSRRAGFSAADSPASSQNTSLVNLHPFLLHSVYCKPRYAYPLCCPSKTLVDRGLIDGLLGFSRGPGLLSAECRRFAYRCGRSTAIVLSDCLEDATCNADSSRTQQACYRGTIASSTSRFGLFASNELRPALCCIGRKPRSRRRRTQRRLLLAVQRSASR